MPSIPGMGEALERGAQSITSKLEESSGGKTVLNLLGNQEWELDLTEGGRAIKGMHDNYIKLHDQALKAENDKIAQLREWHKNDATARKTVPVDAPVAQFHAHAVATRHPIAKVTGDLVSRGDGGFNQNQLMLKNQQMARLAGISGSYGAHFENATPILANMLRDNDPRIVANAHRVADIISNQVRDTKQIMGHGKQSVSNASQSYAKATMNSAFKSANKIFKATEDKQIPYLKTDATYEKQEPWERTAHRILDTVMLPFLAVKHVGQFFNIAASSPLPALGASLLRMDHAAMEQTVEASSITATTMWSAMYTSILGESGKIANWTHSPELGKILAHSIHEPGFSFLRRYQLSLSGSVGFHSAIYWAKEFATKGTAIAKARLEEMNIKPDEVLAQKGQLTEAQLQNGVYHFTNNRMFFHRSIDNSLWQNRNVFARAGFMYHSFVNSQASYMRRELLTMLKAGDVKGLAQFAGTMMVLFPAMAPLLSGAEKVLTTGSISQGAQETESRYKRLASNPFTLDWAGNYLNLISHIGAAGVYFNYINAIKAHRLASAMAGPLVGAATTDVSDVANAAFFPSESGGHNWKPVERDALRQLIPVAGGAIAHHLVPTEEEEPHRTFRHGSFKNRLRISGRRR